MKNFLFMYISEDGSEIRIFYSYKIPPVFDTTFFDA